MRVLLIHNLYQQPGGEDSVFEAERKLLAEHGHKVETVLFDNRELKLHPIRIMMGALFNRASRKVVERKIKEFRPDVIHVHNFIFVASPSIFYAAAEYNIPVVLTLHNYRLLCPGATLMSNGKNL